MDAWYTLAIFLVLLGTLGVPYWIHAAKQRRAAVRRLEKSARAGLGAPVTLHPHIDLLKCIGCAGCVRICPEEVLGIVRGRAAIVNGMRCIGHALCADVCPVGAIALGFGAPKQGMEIPYYDGETCETNIEHLYVIGELGGIGLIKNAVRQGIAAMRHVADATRSNPAHDYDAIIVGAGPAGLAAALTARAHELRYVVLEQEDIGGTIYHYPRRKLVLTEPVDLPLYGRLKVSEITKEALLDIWQNIISTYQLSVRTHRKVDAVEPGRDGFTVRSGEQCWTAGAVLLALGRRGSPRKLGVPGEHLPKVAYRLIEAERYTNAHPLVVGGGDSAVEAAMALADQPGNTVTLSYRRGAFTRLKERNEVRIEKYMDAGRIHVIFQSNAVEITPERVRLRTEDGMEHDLENDAVFIFAGGELPTALLTGAGVKLRTSEGERGE